MVIALGVILVGLVLVAGDLCFCLDWFYGLDDLLCFCWVCRHIVCVGLGLRWVALDCFLGVVLPWVGVCGCFWAFMAVCLRSGIRVWFWVVYDLVYFALAGMIYFDDWLIVIRLGFDLGDLVVG